jgi:hypothetical protein
MSDRPAMHEGLGAEALSNLKKRVAQDELGCLNYLDAKELPRGMQKALTGQIFTLQVQMVRKESQDDPFWPVRSGIERQDIFCVRTGWLRSLVRAERQRPTLRRLRRAGPGLLPQIRGVVPAARDPQPHHGHDRQRGDLRAGHPYRTAAPLCADAQSRRYAHPERLARQHRLSLHRGRPVGLLPVHHWLKAIGAPGIPFNPVAIR